MELRPTLIQDFKALVAEQGMSEDTIVMKKNKGTDTQSTTFLLDLVFFSVCHSSFVPSGECVPGEQVMPEPQIQVESSVTESAYRNV